MPLRGLYEDIRGILPIRNDDYYWELCGLFNIEINI